MHLYRLYVYSLAHVEVTYISLSAARMIAIKAGLQCKLIGCIYTHVAHVDDRYILLSATRMIAIHPYRHAGLQCILIGCLYTHSRV